MDAMLEHKKQKATDREDKATLALLKLDKEEAIETLRRLTMETDNLEQEQNEKIIHHETSKLRAP